MPNAKPERLLLYRQMLRSRLFEDAVLPNVARIMAQTRAVRE